MTGAPEDKIESAIESVAASEADQAEAAVTAASAIAVDKISEASETAVAAATAGAALAQVESAKVIVENESDISWLKSSVEAQGNSLRSLAERQTAQEAQIQAGFAQMSTALQSLIPKPSEETPPKVKPENQTNQSGNAEDNPDLAPKNKPKRKVRFI